MSSSVTQKQSITKHSEFEEEGKRIEGLSDPVLMEIEAFNSEYILRLTKAALLAGNIPEGDTLVPFLGSGCESSNSEVIENWIRRQVNMLVEIAPQNHVEKIIEEIDNRLTEVKTGYLGNK